MEEIIIKILKENSTYLDRSRSYKGMYEENFEYVAKELTKQLNLCGVSQRSELLKQYNEFVNMQDNGVNLDHSDISDSADWF